MTDGQPGGCWPGSAWFSGVVTSRPMPPEAPARETEALRLGIAITTFNRRAHVLSQVAAIRALTGGSYELVICDDGSADGTTEALRRQGELVIGGVNRGIAWNKNRGLYYLLHVVRCDVVLLLDDDIVPVTPGWEREWVIAAWRYGHVNHAHPSYRDKQVAGECHAAAPGLTTMVPGWAFAYNRFVLAEIGYLDPRFGRYGHEHSDLSFRAVRAGYGGIVVEEAGQASTLFFVIDGGLQGVPSETSGTAGELEANGRLLHMLGAEPVYRHAWRDDQQMAEFLAEIAAAAPEAIRPLITRVNHFATAALHGQSTGRQPGAVHPTRLDNISRNKNATQSSHSSWSFAPTKEADAAGAVNGELDGGRKFHTDIEENPWWQVDLGGIATITEIHIHNTTDAVGGRFRDFTLSVSIDGSAWVALLEKQDGLVVEVPVVWHGPGTAWARFVRVTLLGRNHLHLNQVEVFGRL